MTCSRAAAAETGAEAVGLLPLTAEESSLMAPFTIPLSAFIAMVFLFGLFAFHLRQAAAAVSES